MRYVGSRFLGCNTVLTYPPTGSAEGLRVQASTGTQGLPTRRAHDLGGRRRERKGGSAASLQSSQRLTSRPPSALLPEPVPLRQALHRAQVHVLRREPHLACWTHRAFVVRTHRAFVLITHCPHSSRASCSTSSPTLRHRKTGSSGTSPRSALCLPIPRASLTPSPPPPPPHRKRSRTTTTTSRASSYSRPSRRRTTARFS